MDESNIAPAGSWDADNVTVLAGLGLVAVTVKLIHDPETPVRFPGKASAGGSNACTLTVMVTKLLPWGEVESVTIRVTV